MGWNWTRKVVGSFKNNVFFAATDEYSGLDSQALLIIEWACTYNTDDLGEANDYSKDDKGKKISDRRTRPADPSSSQMYFVRRRVMTDNRKQTDRQA